MLINILLRTPTTVTTTRTLLATGRYRYPYRLTMEYSHACAAWSPGPTIPTPPELDDVEGLMHRPTAPLPSPAYQVEPIATLVRGKQTIKVRRLYGLPPQSAVREALASGFDLVQELLANTTTLRGHTRLRHESSVLNEIQVTVSRMQTLLIPVLQERSGECLSVGFQSVLQEILTHLKLLNQSLLKSHHRRSRKYVRQVVDKLPGLLLHLDLACAMHAIVDQTDGMSPFVPLENTAAMDRVFGALKTFDSEPFFLSHSPNLAYGISSFNYILTKTTAAASRSYDSNSTFLRLAKFIFYNVAYTFATRSAAKQVTKAFRESQFDMRLCKFLWNLPDSGPFRPVFALVYDRVEVDLPFSIPNNIDAPNWKFWQPKLPMANEEDYRRYDWERILRPPRLDRTSPFYQPLIRVRLTSARKEPLLIVAPNGHKGSNIAKVDNVGGDGDQRETKKTSKKDPRIERIEGGFGGHFSLKYPLLADPKPALILQVHGGGFVAMTSFSHLPYIRKWAIDTDMPILSVDYRLAPEYPFPTQLEECYQAYRWAVANSARLGSTGQRVILVGDSAGGNLVAAITLRAIVEGFRIPDGLVLAYPALNLRDEPSCSRLLSSTDPMLNLAMLLQLKSKVLPPGGFSPIHEPFFSLTEAPDIALRRFPPTRIIVGEFDPLLDDSAYFYKRLRALGKDAELSIRPGLGHGFLQLVDVAADAGEAVALTSLWLIELCQVSSQPHMISTTVHESSSGSTASTPSPSPSSDSTGPEDSHVHKQN